VQLVDEQHDAAVRVRHLLERGLEALLELAAELGARDHPGEVERHEPAVLERLGDVALGDPEREALGDGGLADAGLADQDGVVLAAPGEDLDRLLDLGGTPDDRVDAALARVDREVAAERVERRGGGSGRRRGGSRGGEVVAAAVVAREVRGAHVAQDGGAAARARGDHHAHDARPLPAERARGGTVQGSGEELGHVGSILGKM
jgi:hypothetical protein